jgi:hypothetical protein
MPLDKKIVGFAAVVLPIASSSVELLIEIFVLV